MNKTLSLLLLSACLLSASLASLARPIRGVSAASSEEFPANDLPYDAEVEYIESTGEQFIITPVCVSNDMDVKICAAATGLSADGSVIAGARDRSKSVRNYIILISSGFQLTT